jgi:hypothetical protein
MAATGIAGIREGEEKCAETASPDIRRANRTEIVSAQGAESSRRLGDWSPETFAGEQIRGLVRQIFFSNPLRPVRQVLFSAVDRSADVRAICRRVGEALTLETAERVAVVGAYPKIVAEANDLQSPTPAGSAISMLQDAARVRANLWLVPSQRNSGVGASTASLHSLLCDLRREFEFSIIEAPPACESNSAAAMAQLADGIVLVLSAHHTRRPAARKTKTILAAANARILGVVLSDREFPIPERIYRWL